MDFFQIPQQCCDAKHYLAMGEGCATSGDCYNILRPMGAVYWFSIPYRFNLPLDILVILHGLLAMVSVVLSTFVIKKIIFGHLTAGPTNEKYFSPYRLYTMLALSSLLVHSVFLYPVIRHSLSDPPSSLVFLIAIWLLFLLPTKIFSRALALLACGLLLGLAAWIRSFFLYPVLIALGAWLLHTLLSRPFQPIRFVVCVALIPIATQFYVTWQKTGALSYIHPSEASIHQKLVMAEKASGYDTVLPGIGFRSYPACQNYRALGDALEQVDLYSIACLLSGKLHYYLGSYSPHMFWDPDRSDVTSEMAIDFSLPEDQPDEISLHSSNIKKEITAQVSAKDESRALRLWKIDDSKDAEISYTVNLKDSSRYFPSLRAWANDNYQIIIFAIRNHDSGQEINASFSILDKTPHLLEHTLYHHSTGKFDLVIKFPFVDPDTNADTRKLTANGEKINRGSFFVAEAKIGEAELKRERYWSSWILLANALAIVCALLLALRHRKRWSGECWMAFALIALCCAEALLITPEQRFIIAPMIALWILCIIWISTIILPRLSSHHPHGPV